MDVAGVPGRVYIRNMINEDANVTIVQSLLCLKTWFHGCMSFGPHIIPVAHHSSWYFIGPTSVGLSSIWILQKQSAYGCPPSSFLKGALFATALITHHIQSYENAPGLEQICLLTSGTKPTYDLRLNYQIVCRAWCWEWTSRSWCRIKSGPNIDELICTTNIFLFHSTK